MNTVRDMLRQAVDKYMTAARDHGLTASGSGPIRGPLLDTLTALDALDDARDLVHRDPHLNADGKRERLDKLETDARKLVDSNLGTARRRLDDVRRHHEAKVQLPRAVDADLMAARHDVDRLTAKARPGEMHQRLEQAARSSDAIADLLLRDGYGERVVLRAAGSQYDGDAAVWAATKRKLVAERLGPAGEPHLRALEAVHTAGKAATLTEQAVYHALGPAPDAQPAATPIVVSHDHTGG